MENSDSQPEYVYPGRYVCIYMGVGGNMERWWINSTKNRWNSDLLMNSDSDIHLYVGLFAESINSSEAAGVIIIMPKAKVQKFKVL